MLESSLVMILGIEEQPITEVAFRIRRYRARFCKLAATLNLN
jgi:hypothetical protein